MPHAIETSLVTIDDWDPVPLTGLDVRLSVTFCDPAGTSVADHKDHRLQHSNEERLLHRNLTSDTVHFMAKNTGVGAAVARVVIHHAAETEDGDRVASRRTVANLAPGEDTGPTELPPGCSLTAEPQPATLIWTRDHWLDITGCPSTDQEYGDAAERLIENYLADFRDVVAHEYPRKPDFKTPDLAVDIAGTRTVWEVKAIHTSRSHEKVAEQLAESGRATHTFVNEANGYAGRLVKAEKQLAEAAEAGHPTIAALVNLTDPRDPYVTEPYSIASMLKGKPKVHLQTGAADREFRNRKRFPNISAIAVLDVVAKYPVPEDRTQPSARFMGDLKVLANLKLYHNPDARVRLDPALAGSVGFPQYAMSPRPPAEPAERPWIPVSHLNGTMTAEPPPGSAHRHGILALDEDDVEHQLLKIDRRTTQIAIGSEQPVLFDHYFNRITRSPDVCHGKSRIRDTRVTVVDILTMLASGMSHKQIADSLDFSEVDEHAVVAAIRFAASMLESMEGRK